MTSTAITRDEAKELARERLVEILAEVIPDFRPEKAFRCVNPEHEDVHPSMRYSSRTHMVKCFACGWKGDTFDVAAAVYGLSGGAVFDAVYAMLGLEVGRGGKRGVRKPPSVLKPGPGSWAEIAALIWPNGPDDEPKVRLPVPLATTAEVEAGLVGILLKHRVDALVCIQAGLRAEHFDDAELAELYDDLILCDDLAEYPADFLAWVKNQAVARHLLRRLVRFVVAEGRKRQMEAAFAAAFTSFQNNEHPDMILEDVLNAAELIMDASYDMPDADEDGMHDRLDAMFGQWFVGDDPLGTIAQYRRVEATA
jgi:hypothetical protein